MSEGPWVQAAGWVPAAVDGDPAAIEQLIRLTQADVWRFIASLAGPGSADDLTQDTYLRALSSLGSFEGRSGLRTWLLVIARRTVADHLRRQATRTRLAPTTGWDSPAVERAGLSTPDAASAFAITDLVDRLDPDRREALMLTQFLGLSYAEAAAVADCPVGTIRSRVARARADIARQLGDLPEERPDQPPAARAR